jgi:DNA-binding NarL/FixJ family response regulator
MRLLLADDQSEVRLALEMLLKQEPGVTVAGTVSEAESLLALVRTTRPDLVLLDWELPGQQPIIDIIPTLHTLDVRPKIIALSSHPEAERPALAAGVDAFVSKSDPPDRLLAVFRRLRRSDEAANEAD